MKNDKHQWRIFIAHNIGVYEEFDKENCKLGKMINEFESTRITDVIKMAKDVLSYEQKNAIKRQSKSGAGAIFSPDGRLLSSI